MLVFMLWQLGSLTSQTTYEKEMSFVSSPVSAYRYTEILATGRISKETPEKFSKFVTSAGISAAVVSFDSGGGDLEAGMALGRKIREFGFATQVGSLQTSSLQDNRSPFGEAKCESSCAYSFLGGVSRNILPHPSSGTQKRLGFHQFRTNLSAGHGTPRSLDSLSVSAAQTFSSRLSEYIFEMGANPAILKLADSAPLSLAGDDPIHYPDISILNSNNVTTNEEMPPFRLVASPSSISLVSFSRSQYNSIRQFSISCTTRGRDTYLTFSYTVQFLTTSAQKDLKYFDPEELIAQETPWTNGRTHFPIDGIHVFVDNKQLPQNGQKTIQYAGHDHIERVTERLSIESKRWGEISSAKELSISGYVAGIGFGSAHIHFPPDKQFQNEMKAVQRSCISAPKNLLPPPF